LIKAQSQGTDGPDRNATNMGDIVKIIRVNLEQHDGGLICASSPDLPGMVLINRDLALIKADIPNVIRLIMKRKGFPDVEVREAISESEKSPRVMPDWVAIPKHERVAACA
jgi:hypothetical protein